MTFTPASAERYLKSKVSVLFQKRKEIETSLGTLYALKRHHPDKAGELETRIQKFLGLLNEQTQLEERVRALLPSSVTSGLGFAPLVIGAAAVALASAVYLHLQKVNQQKQELDLIARGLATPEQIVKMQEAQTAGGLGGTLASVKDIAVIGLTIYGLVVFGPLLMGIFHKGREA